MTIDDQVQDEKLQYDINREAEKILTLLSDKINKYQYLTGEEILSSNQKQIMEQAEFTYSLLEKQKQLKTKEKKQIKAIEGNEKQLANTTAYSYENKLLLSKEKKISKNIYNERIDKMEELSKIINYDELKFTVQSSGQETDFSKISDPIVPLNDVRANKILIEEAQDLQEKINGYFKKIRIGKKMKNKKKNGG